MINVDTMTCIATLIKNYMSLDSNHIYIMNQKTIPIKGTGLYVVISSLGKKVYANNPTYTKETVLGVDHFYIVTGVNTQETLHIDLISYDESAAVAPEMVAACLQGYEAQESCVINGMSISINPVIVDASFLEGTKQNFRKIMTVNVLRVWQNKKEIPYYDSYPGYPSVITDK